jgi:hypothetical protein
MEIELIYDDDCPNIERARAHLDRTGLPKEWTEWSREEPDAPNYVHRYGSPNILVDGTDVAGTSPGEGAKCCRISADRSGALSSAAAVEANVARLDASASE